jgi:hypothetical protein
MALILERQSSEQRASGDFWNGALHGATRCLCRPLRNGPADIGISNLIRRGLPAFIPIHVTYLPLPLCCTFLSCPLFVLSATASLNLKTLATATRLGLSCTSSHWQFVLQRAHHELTNILHLDSLPVYCDERWGACSRCCLISNLISAESVMPRRKRVLECFFEWRLEQSVISDSQPRTLAGTSHKGNREENHVDGRHKIIRLPRMYYLYLSS